MIGGASIYEIAISNPNCKGIFLTEITGPMMKGDVFFPIKELQTSLRSISVNQFAHDLIKDCSKNISFDGESFSEKNFNYKFMFYH